MSRIGKQPIKIPKDVTVSLQNGLASFSGPKGSLSMQILQDIELEKKDDDLLVSCLKSSRRAQSLWGLQRALAANNVTGVSQGFSRELRIVGVGFRAQVKGKNLHLSLGHSHEIVYPFPDGVQISCPRPTLIQLSGCDKQKVGQTAAEIRSFRPPEPYKGKGVAHANEYIFRKEGKKK